MSVLNEIRRKDAELNAAIKVWTRETSGSMNDKIQQLQLVDSGKLFKRLGYKFRSRDGQIDRIRWTAPRYGFVLANVGRSYTVEGGRMLIENGKRTYFGREIKGGDKSTDWIFEIIKQNLKDLGDLLAKLESDKAVNASRILTTAKRINE